MSNVTRVLVVVAGKTVDGEKLGAALEQESEVEIKVIAPALTAAHLAAVEDPSAGGGEADPLGAIEDALAGFEADQIVLVPASDERPTWAEEGLLEEARERFTVPIRELA
jgi:hypothetical protein